MPRKPGRRQLEELHREALLLDYHRSLPRECPDGSGRRAPAGQHWARSIRTADWVLETDGTWFSLSVASEAYWQA